MAVEGRCGRATGLARRRASQGDGLRTRSPRANSARSTVMRRGKRGGPARRARRPHRGRLLRTPPPWPTSRNCSANGERMHTFEGIATSKLPSWRKVTSRPHRGARSAAAGRSVSSSSSLGKRHDESRVRSRPAYTSASSRTSPCPMIENRTEKRPMRRVRRRRTRVPPASTSTRCQSTSRFTKRLQRIRNLQSTVTIRIRRPPRASHASQPRCRDASSDSTLGFASSRPSRARADATHRARNSAQPRGAA
jgi:hypothetical protein